MTAHTVNATALCCSPSRPTAVSAAALPPCRAAATTGHHHCSAGPGAGAGAGGAKGPYNPQALLAAVCRVAPQFKVCVCVRVCVCVNVRV